MTPLRSLVAFRKRAFPKVQELTHHLSSSSLAALLSLYSCSLTLPNFSLYPTNTLIFSLRPLSQSSSHYTFPLCVSPALSIRIHYTTVEASSLQSSEPETISSIGILRWRSLLRAWAWAEGTDVALFHTSELLQYTNAETGERSPSQVVIQRGGLRLTSRFLESSWMENPWGLP